MTDEELEKHLNRWTEEGYLLDGIHFVVREASKRPAMAFILFTQKEGKRREKGR